MIDEELRGRLAAIDSDLRILREPRQGGAHGGLFGWKVSGWV